MKRKRPKNPHLATINRMARWRYIAQLMLIGLAQEQIARRLGMTGRNVRYIVGQPEFELIYSELLRERDKRMARMIEASDYLAVKGLQRRLTDEDPRIQLTAIELFYRLRGKGLEKREPSMPTVGGGDDGSISERQLDDMSPQQRNAWRDATRKLLEVTRDARRPRSYGSPDLAEESREPVKEDRPRAMWDSPENVRTMDDQKPKPPKLVRRPLDGIV